MIPAVEQMEAVQALVRGLVPPATLDCRTHRRTPTLSA